MLPAASSHPLLPRVGRVGLAGPSRTRTNSGRAGCYPVAFSVQGVGGRSLPGGRVSPSDTGWGMSRAACARIVLTSPRLAAPRRFPVKGSRAAWFQYCWSGTGESPCASRVCRTAVRMGADRVLSHPLPAHTVQTMRDADVDGDNQQVRPCCLTGECYSGVVVACGSLRGGISRGVAA
jgi:hypothetical protein